MLNKNSLVFILIILFLASWVKPAVVIYIAPDPIDNESCTDTGHRFKPCHPLHQLNETSLSNKDDVTLFFFSGTHVILENHTLSVSNTSQLVILAYPWNQRKVELKCQVPAHLQFQNVKNLQISAILFTSCTLKSTRPERTPNIFQHKLGVMDCVFANRGISYAIIAISVDVTIDRCIFQSNYGAINCNNTAACYSKFIVTIKDTKFFNNERENGNGMPSLLNAYMLQLKDASLLKIVQL